MVALRFERVLALPSPAIANTIYFVRPVGADVALQYVTGNDGLPVLVGGGTSAPTPTPAPVFTTQPSLSPTYVIAGNPITITPGVVTGATSTTRAALLNGTALTITNNTVTPNAAGTLAYQETATGPGGTTLSTQRTATVAAATPTPTPGVSTFVGPSTFELGFNQLDYFGNGFPFLDRSKCSEWRAPDINNNQVAITYNADRYPTAIPAGATKLQCLINVEGPKGPAGVAQRYAIETNLTDMVYTVGSGGTLGNPQTSTPSPGVKRYEFTLGSDIPADGGNGSYRIDMNVTALPTGFVAGTHYIRMFRIDEEAAFKSGGIFTEQFKSRLALVSAGRMMDWNAINHPVFFSWADRAKVSWNTWNENFGVPLEIQIELCNQTNTHLYANIPAQIGVTGVVSTASDGITEVTDDINIAYAYIDQMMALIDANLKPSLKCQIEFNNEPWNYGFKQYFYLRSIRPLLKPSGADYENAQLQQGYRGTRLMGRAMKAVGYNPRFIPVMCGQAVNSDIALNNIIGSETAMAEWANTSHANYDAALASRYKEVGTLYRGGLGIAPYFHGGVGVAPNFDGTGGSSANDKATILSWAAATDNSGYDAAIRQLEYGDVLEWGSANSLSGFDNAFGANFALADSRQLPIFAYEFNFEIPAARGNAWAPGTAGDIASRDFYRRLFLYPGFRALMLKAMNLLRLKGMYNTNVLADFGPDTDTYGTLNNAYGPLTPRGLAMQDFKASPGPARALAITLPTTGSFYTGNNPVTKIKAVGGVGMLTVTVSGLAPGRTYDGFRTISGALTTPGTTTLTVTATDEATPPNTVTQTLDQVVTATPASAFSTTDKAPNLVLSNSNRTATRTVVDSNNYAVRANTTDTTGILKFNVLFNSSTRIAFGLSDKYAPTSPADTHFWGGDDHEFIFYNGGYVAFNDATPRAAGSANPGATYLGDAYPPGAPTFAAGDTANVWFNRDTRRLIVGKNGTWSGGDPTANGGQGTGGVIVTLALSVYIPVIIFDRNGAATTDQATISFPA